MNDETPLGLISFADTQLERLGVPYFVTGSIAAMTYGEARGTIDVDLVVTLRRDQVAELVRAFPQADFYVSEDAARQAVHARSQFNVLQPATGFRIDFMVAEKTPFNDSRFSRRSRRQLSDRCEAWVASPEDIVLMKLKYHRQGGSTKHLRDIAGMFDVSGESIDIGYIETWAGKLGLLQHWHDVRES